MRLMVDIRYSAMREMGRGMLSCEWRPLCQNSRESRCVFMRLGWVKMKLFSSWWADDNWQNHDHIANMRSMCFCFWQKAFIAFIVMSCVLCWVFSKIYVALFGVCSLEVEWEWVAVLQVLYSNVFRHLLDSNHVTRGFNNASSQTSSSTQLCSIRFSRNLYGR